MGLSRKKKLVYATFLFLFVWGFLEAALRLGLALAPSEIRHRYLPFDELVEDWLLYQPHPYLSYALTPGYVNGKVRHNSLGYRGKEITSPKPKGLFRIVAMGGSTTYTIAVDDDVKTYPALVESLLQQQLGKRRVDVVNAGVAGYTSYESLVNLQFRILDLKPDLLIGNSKGFTLSRKTGIPLIRVGFPIHDRISGPRSLHLGYRGAQVMFDKIVDKLMEIKQSSNDIGYTYI